jgi:hypothetical protein
MNKAVEGEVDEALEKEVVGEKSKWQKKWKEKKKRNGRGIC